MPQTAEQLSKGRLKALVRSIVIGQGNDFIKELLREHGIKIGTTKSDFLDNLNQAIESGLLTQLMLESWLEKVEGWGNQHIYLLSPLSLTQQQIENKINSSEFASLVNKPNSHEFPEELALTTVSVTESMVSLVWHEGDISWTRASAKDYRKEEGLDLFEYRAFRQRSKRTVLRFEWEYNKPYSSLFTQASNERNSHAEAIQIVQAALIRMGLIDQPLSIVTLNNSVNRLKSAPQKIVAKSMHMQTAGGYVMLVSTGSGGIEDVDAVREVGLAVNENNFSSASGLFKIEHEVHEALSRTIKFEVFGRDGRIKIWVQCKRDDIYTMMGLIWSYNQIAA